MSGIEKALRTVAHFRMPDVKLKAWSIRIAATAVFFVGMATLVAARMNTTKASYDLQNAHSQRQKLKAEIAKIELERANLSRPERIAEIARQKLGLVPDREVKITLLGD